MCAGHKDANGRGPGPPVPRAGAGFALAPQKPHPRAIRRLGAWVPAAAKFLSGRSRHASAPVAGPTSHPQLCIAHGAGSFPTQPPPSCSREPGTRGWGGRGRDREASRSLYFNCPAPRPLLEAGRGAGCRSRKHLWFLWGPLRVSLAFRPLGTCVFATTALVKAGPCAHRDPQPGLGHFLPFDIFTAEVSCGDGGVGR